MAIDYRGLRSLAARELIAALKQDGYTPFRAINIEKKN
jgi:hypothetical protein